MAILLDHYSGKLLFWISSRQVNICPISEKSLAYSEKIYKDLKKEGYQVTLNKTNNTINKKIREAEIAYYSYIIVIGIIYSSNSR